MNAITITPQGVNINVSVYVFKDGNAFVAYCPSLDLSGYDTTVEKAKKDFEFMLTDWLKTQMSNHTLHQDLSNHGWNLDSKNGREPELADMLKRNKTMKTVVSMPEYQKTNITAEVYS